MAAGGLGHALRRVQHHQPTTKHPTTTEPVKIPVKMLHDHVDVRQPKCQSNLVEHSHHGEQPGLKATSQPRNVHAAIDGLRGVGGATICWNWVPRPD